MRVFYFGCIDVAGHYMHASSPPRNLEERRAVSQLTHSNPWGLNIDGGLCPRRGGALVHHKDGWTALAFEDFTVDSRPGSNSVFLAEGTYDFDEMARIAEEYFPAVWARCGRGLIPAKV